MVVPYLYNGTENRVELLAFTFLDVVEEKFTHFETTDILYFIGRPIVEKEGDWVIHAQTPGRRQSEVRIDPKRLQWHSWRGLTGTSESPPPDLSGNDRSSKLRISLRSMHARGLNGLEQIRVVSIVNRHVDQHRP